MSTRGKTWRGGPTAFLMVVSAGALGPGCGATEQKELVGQTAQALGGPNGANASFYDGFENTALAEEYLSALWLVTANSSPAPAPVGPAASWGSASRGWVPTYGENVSIARHMAAQEVIPGTSQLGGLGGDYWNTAYPIGVVGDFYLGTGDVRPTNAYPWNFNPSGTSGVQDTALDALRFEAITVSPLVADSNDPTTRYFSFLIGGKGSIDAAPYIAFEVDGTYPACNGNIVTGQGYVPLPGVDVFYGYRGTSPTIANRLTDVAQTPDIAGTTAKYALTTRSETMTLVIMDLWGQKTASGVLNNTNPHAGTMCHNHNARIHIYDNSTGGHLNLDEVMVSDITGIANNYPTTPFGATVAPNPALADHPSTIYGWADLHTHWMMHMGNGADAIPTVNANGNRKKLDGILSAMSFLWGQPYGPSTLPANEVCPSMANGTLLGPCAAISDPAVATCGSDGMCTFTDEQRDNFLLAECDAIHLNAASKHENRGSDEYWDVNYRSDDASSNLLHSMADDGNTGCDTALGSSLDTRCFHGSWGYSQSNGTFSLPRKPFMSAIHQQMYWKWVKRAWQGGLRLMVTDVAQNVPLELLMNNFWPIKNMIPSMTPAGSGNGADAIAAHATDEQVALRRQVCAVENMVRLGGGDLGFARIVTTPAAARDAIKAGWLAIVLGSELDSHGSLRAGMVNGTYSPTAEVEFLHGLGISKITPVHALDNKLSGAAVMNWEYPIESDAMNLPNDSMAGANCSTAQNYDARQDPNQDPFAYYNQWLYRPDLWGAWYKDPHNYSARVQDVYAHVATGELSCTFTYNPFFQISKGGAVQCSNYSVNDGSGLNAEIPDCWSVPNFPQIMLAPGTDTWNQVTYNVGADFAASGRAGAGVPARVTYINPMVLSQHIVDNNDGYVPNFIDCASANYQIYMSPAPPVGACTVQTDLAQQYLSTGFYPHSSAGNPGTVNLRGLNTAGPAYITALQMRGMLVDVDHMSELGRREVYNSMWPAGCSTIDGQTQPFAPTSAACQKGAYPVLSTHSTPRAPTQEAAHLPLDHPTDQATWFGRKTERMIADFELAEVPQLGGTFGLSTEYGMNMVAPALYSSPGYDPHFDLTSPSGAYSNGCPGSSEAFLQAYRYAAWAGERSWPYWDFAGPVAIRRPSQWRAGGIGFGSDFNGVRGQLGARFNQSAEACKDPTGAQDQDGLASAQKAAVTDANAVVYSSGSVKEVGITDNSLSPNSGSPPQPAMDVLRAVPSLAANDIAVWGSWDGNFPPVQLTGFDFNYTGLANIGQEPDLIQDMVNLQRANAGGKLTVADFEDNRYQMRYLFRSAEDFIQTWEKAVAWCKANNADPSKCDGATLNADQPLCDPWWSDADGIGPDATAKSNPGNTTGLEAALSDSTPSCAGRCGESLEYKDHNGQTRWCDCFVNRMETGASPVSGLRTVTANICDDFKPWCSWFYQGTDNATGDIGDGVPVQRSPGCASGEPEQVFSGGMVACGGNATWSSLGLEALCGADYAVCTADQWVSNFGGVAPKNNYWLQNTLNRDPVGQSGNCQTLDAPAGSSCGAEPMRVCGASVDAYGNACGPWMGCGYNSYTNAFIGGCGSASPGQSQPTAGVLCCLNEYENACSSLATASEAFAPGVAGCAGKVRYADRAKLCAGGCTPCKAADWVKYKGAATPSHDYWVDEALGRSGSGPQHCQALTMTQNCGDAPMRVCVPSSGGWAHDPEGNICEWDTCSLDTDNNANDDFGGCGGDLTAGTLCCCGG